ncbi:DUF99 family protein [Candidatus Woesearchaeota archaeon]|nr:DUF99 family protein [Candidatus Woesearchaeota archaeon]
MNEDDQDETVRAARLMTLARTLLAKNPLVQIKKHIRVVGFDDAPFRKNKDKKTWVIGTVTRGGDQVDGFMSFQVNVDGDEATDSLIECVNRSRFKHQLQCIFLDGIAVGGFNLIDVQKLSLKTGLPVINVMRDYPDFEKMKSAMQKIGRLDKWEFIERAGLVSKVENLYVQSVGIRKDRIAPLLKIVCTHSFIPEPIRLSHLIGAALVLGESKGKA